MGLADLFKRGLEKTRNFFAGGFTKLAANSGRFDEDMLDELEELLYDPAAYGLALSGSEW